MDFKGVDFVFSEEHAVIYQSYNDFKISRPGADCGILYS